MSNLEIWTRVRNESNFSLRVVPTEGTTVTAGARLLPTQAAPVEVPLAPGEWLKVPIVTPNSYSIRVTVAFPLRAGSATIQAFLENPGGTVRKKKYAYGVAPTATDLEARATLILITIGGEE